MVISESGIEFKVGQVVEDASGYLWLVTGIKERYIVKGKALFFAGLRVKKDGTLSRNSNGLPKGQSTKGIKRVVSELSPARTQWMELQRRAEEARG